MKVAAVVVHYGPQEPTVAVAAAAATVVDEVIVASNDGSARPFGLPGAVRWLTMNRNLGYAAAFQQAAESSDADVLAVLNNDVDFPAESFRRCVDAFALDPRIGVVGPVLRYPDGRLQSGAGRLTPLLRAPIARQEPRQGITDCEWVTGAAMLIRADVLKAVGMDGSYFLGYEDTDLCVRVRRAGHRVVCHGGAPAVHHGSQVISGPRWSYYAPRNRVWFARACFGLPVAALTWIGQVARIPRVAAADLVKRRDLTSTRLSLLAARHAWMPKPSAAEGPHPDEPLAARVMRW